MFGAIPFLISNESLIAKVKALNKYGFLSSILEPFPEK